MRYIGIAILIAAGLLHAAAAQGAASLTLAPAGNSGYVLQGAAMDGTAGLDLTVSYDPSVLSAPQVAPGPLLSGAMVAVNPNVPGSIRVSAVTLTPLNGSGVLLTITFTRQIDGQGIHSLAARLIDLNGRSLPSLAQLAPGNDGAASNDQGNDQGPVANRGPQDHAAQTGTPSGAAGAGSGTSSGTMAPSNSGITAVGPLVGPASTPTPPAAQDENEQIAMTEPVAPDGRHEEAPAPVRSEQPDVLQTRSRPVYTQPSILERFRDFRGKRTVQAYLALFDQEPLIGFRHDPAVVLSDGVGTMTVHFISTPDREHASDLALIGAKLISSRRDPAATNTWIATVLPEAGTIEAAIAVTQKSALMVDPLTVAPRVDIDLDRSGAVSEEDFVLFLAERDTGKTPNGDLNGDGVRDFRDVFIFTANYIVARHGGSGRPGDERLRTPGKRAGSRSEALNPH